MQQRIVKRKHSLLGRGTEVKEKNGIKMKWSPYEKRERTGQRCGLGKWGKKGNSGRKSGKIFAKGVNAREMSAEKSNEEQEKS